MNPTFHKILLVIGLVAALLIPGVRADNDPEAVAVFQQLKVNMGRGWTTAMKNFKVDGDITVHDDGEPWSGTVEILFQHPDKYRREIKRGKRGRGLGCNGDVHWRFDSGDSVMSRRRYAAPGEDRYFTRLVQTQLSRLLDLDPAAEVLRLVEEPFMWQGLECRSLKYYPATEPSGWIKLIIDTDAFLLRRLEYYVVNGETGEYQEYALDFADYVSLPQKVNYPQQIREYKDGVLTSEIVITSLHPNANIPNHAFDHQRSQ